VWVFQVPVVCIIVPKEDNAILLRACSWESRVQKPNCKGVYLSSVIWVLIRMPTSKLSHCIVQRAPSRFPLCPVQMLNVPILMLRSDCLCCGWGLRAVMQVKMDSHGSVKQYLMCCG